MVQVDWSNICEEPLLMDFKAAIAQAVALTPSEALGWARDPAFIDF